MKILAYYPLHYGKEYFEASLQSIVKVVDKIIILYTPTPSQGFATPYPVPDTREELREIALRYNAEWVDGEWGQENAHRSYIYQYADGYDLILAVDADEIWDENILVSSAKEALKSGAKYIGIRGFVNFWKSFNHACYDGFTPIRFVNLVGHGNFVVDGKIYHFSCAQSYLTMRYKLSVTGHKDEIKPNWLEHVYLRWSKENNFGDLHPTAIGLWNACDFDKNSLPSILKRHPNFNKDAIY